MDSQGPDLRRFTDGDIVRAREALARFRDETEALVKASGVLPLPGSPADLEEKAFPRLESLRTAYSQSIMLIEVAADQLTAFLKTISEPCETIAPWTCVRALLESSALGAWILHPTISVEDRIARSLALRYEGLEQQAKYLRCYPDQDLERTSARLKEVAALAKELGYAEVTDRNGKTIGAGTRMPPVTEVVGNVLDEEPMYRLLSAVAHGHFWAIHQVGFTQVELADEDVTGGRRALAKAVNPLGVMYLSMGAGRAFGRLLWSQFSYSGWNREPLAEALDGLFESGGIPSGFQFWHA